MKNIIMVRSLLMLILVVISLNVAAQKFTNLQAKKEAGKLIVSYDLSTENPDQSFDVRLECSSDGGATFNLIPQIVSGDVKGISAGTGKRIIWDVLSENKQIALNQLMFQLVATPVVLKNSEKGSHDSSIEKLAGRVDATGTFTDPRDGHTYKYIQIGSQTWMAENLAYLPTVSPAHQEAQSNPFYYVYGYNGTDVLEAKTTSNYKTYGVLYNWTAAKVACPAGWHLPSEEEWKQLEIAFGMSSDQVNSKGMRGGTTGSKLKAAEGWNKSGNGTNESQFTALPGGGRYGEGSFGNLGGNGYWWSASEFEGNFSWGRGLSFDSSQIYNGVNYKEGGFSVRCIKDK
jgi:uncharacterized protein (TIGR02145 family)